MVFLIRLSVFFQYFCQPLFLRNKTEFTGSKKAGGEGRAGGWWWGGGLENGDGPGVKVPGNFFVSG